MAESRKKTVPLTLAPQAPVAQLAAYFSTQIAIFTIFGTATASHSTTLTARPPFEVYLYFDIMSSPVCFIVAMA